MPCAAWRKRIWMISTCLALAAQLLGATSGAAQVHEIASDTIVARMTGDGALVSIAPVGAEGLLAGPAVRLRIAEHKTNRSIDDARVPPRNTKLTGAKLVIEKELENADLSWTHTFEATSALSWKITFQNLSDSLRAVDAEFALQLKGSDFEAFFPGQNDFPEWPDGGTLHYCYQFFYGNDVPVVARRNPLVLPLACVYSRTRNVGFSVVADLDAPILPATFELSRSAEGVQILLARPHLRLDPGGSRTIVVHLVPHAGDWRACLAWVRDRWPECFWVPQGLEKFQSAQYGWISGLGYHYPEQYLSDAYWRHDRFRNWPWKTGVAHMAGFDRWRGQWIPAVAHKWTHMTRHPEVYPEGFLDGMPPADAPYGEIVKFVESRKPTRALREKLQGIRKKGSPGEYAPSSPYICLWDRVTTDKLREFLDVMHRNNVYGFYYLNPRDVWYPYARDEFPDSLVSGPTLAYGFDWTICDPYAGSAFRKKCIDEVERLFRLYPDIDGIFLDQCFGSNRNLGKDDGLFLDEELTPLSAFSWDLACLIRDIAKIAHDNGKYVWQNHCHERIDITRYCDLALVEGRIALGMGQEPTRYATIGNRCCVTLGPRERQYQAALRNGWYAGQLDVPPLDRAARLTARDRMDKMTARGADNLAWTSRLYYPLFDLLRGRHWVLQPHCITAPDGMEGSLFKRPDGNYVAALVSFGETRTTPWLRLDVPLTVRFHGASEIKAAYVFNNDRLGPLKIPFTRMDDEITITIPRHRSASAVLLAKSGRFVSLESGPSVRKGAQERIVLAFDNFTEQLWSWKGTAWTKHSPHRFYEEISAGKGVSRGFAAETKTFPGDPFLHFRLAMDSDCLIPAPDGAPERVATFELYAEEPIQAFVAPPRKLIARSLSNSNQGGYVPFHQALPLHLCVGESASFEVGLVNNSDTIQEITLTLEGERTAVEDAPSAVRVGARSHRRIIVKAKGTEVGHGSLRLKAVAEAGSADFTLPIEVIGGELAQADLARVRSVALLADVWGRVNSSKKKTVHLNNVEVADLAGGHGAPMWTTILRTSLGDDALKAIKTANDVRIENPKKDNIKVRNVVLEVTLNTGSIIHLRSDPSVRSTSPSWMHAEGVRVEAGKPMTWEMPAR